MLSQTFAKVVSDRARRFTSFGRLLRNERGAIAIWFALSVVPLTVVTFGLVDLNRATIQKHNLQDALDSAALYAARSSATNDAQLKVQGDKALNANIQLKGGAHVTSSTFHLDGVKVVATASAKVPAMMANLWLGGDMTVSVNSEVMRNSNNVEVAMVLDTTGSMAGTKIADLKIAAAELVDIVVKPQQTPFYSKVAIVPYSMAVNPGSSALAASIRGSIAQAKPVSGVAWFKDASQKSITKITSASQAVVTSNGHGYSDGDLVYLTGISGDMSNLNDKTYTVANKTSNTFKLKKSDGSYVNTNGDDQANNGKAQRCLTNECEVVVTANSHGFNTDDRVRLTGISGQSSLTSALNDKNFLTTKLSTNTFRLNGQKGPGLGSYSSGGSAWCTVYGCEYLSFINTAGVERTHQVSTCVTERTGSNKFNDTSPGTTPMGLNYPAASISGLPSPYSANPCTSSTLYPLSSDIGGLKGQITNLTAGGSTGGHVGVGWGWYMVSPNFGNLWASSTNRPAAYNTPNTLKVVVLMTDGEYNSAYCNGVISADSTTGSGDARDHVNCNAPNGHSFNQSTSLCTAMKAAGVIVYTVGFNIVDDQRARDLVNNCATDAKHVYIANGGTALKDAFSAIGREIDNLRLSK